MAVEHHRTILKTLFTLLSLLFPSKGTFYGFASGLGKAANDRKGDTNSPFAKALVKYLDTENQDIAVVFRAIREDVEKHTYPKQVPQMEEKLQGQFYFNKVNKDSDGDLIPDSIDECDYQKGIMKANGCPDTDKDGVPNYRDDCPTEYGLTQNGCPNIEVKTVKDSDGDGFTDNVDNCPYQYAKTNGGCPKGLMLKIDKNRPIMVFVRGNSTVNDFYIGKYEVTVEEYLAFCSATNSNYPEWLEKGSQYNIKTGNNNHYKKIGYRQIGSNNLPIVGISWYNAIKYCKWLSETTGQNYRLPTEEEWEYAAKGGIASKRYDYAGSNKIDKVAWYYGNSNGKPHSVGQKKANDLKIYDMSGNVWEWCSDWYDSDKTTPVLRGGSWGFSSTDCRVTYRYFGILSIRTDNIGFRVVKED